MMKKIITITLLVLALFVCSATRTQADVRLPKTLTSNAVLQRNVPVNVWGWADPGEKISVSFGKNTVQTTAGADGRWIAKLPAMDAEVTGKDLVIKGKNVVTLNNVVVGEVWVCGGQSNMEQPLNSWGQARLSCTEQEINGDYSFVRYNRAVHLLAAEPLEDVNCSGWVVCKDGDQKRCTAAGFHFAVRLYKELGVPVGLIDVNWGGSRIDSWIPDDGWKIFPELASYVDQLLKARDLVLKAPGYQKATVGMGNSEYAKKCPNTMGAMYNAMMAPWTQYTIRGAIWYQGCSNTSDREIYYVKQKAMIAQWRKIWNQGNFPFYWVQLANFTAPTDDPNISGNWPALRDAQTKCLDVPNTGQAVIIDIGETRDIHPRNKFDVGNRLALWALANIFGQKINFKSPMFKEMKIQGNKATLKFDSVGGGLIVGRKDGLLPVYEDTKAKLARFAIAGDDQKWYWADAKIVDKDTVVLSCDKVARPVAVRYAWQANPLGCNLYSKEGLPATPFRTDDWK